MFRDQAFLDTETSTDDEDELPEHLLDGAMEYIFAEMHLHEALIGFDEDLALHALKNSNDLGFPPMVYYEN